MELKWTSFHRFNPGKFGAGCSQRFRPGDSIEGSGLAACGREGSGLAACDREGSGLAACGREGSGLAACRRREGSGLSACRRREGSGLSACFRREGSGLSACRRREGSGLAACGLEGSGSVNPDLWRVGFGEICHPVMNIDILVFNHDFHVKSSPELMNMICKLYLIKFNQFSVY